MIRKLLSITALILGFLFGCAFIVNAATTEQRTYKITWDQMTDPTVKTVRVYLVDRATSTPTWIADYPDNATTVEVTMTISSDKSYYLQASAMDEWGNESVLSTPATKDGKQMVMKVVTTLSTLKVLDLMKIIASGFVVTPK